jgi:O-antigen/teichoic acid export membrane protein
MTAHRITRGFAWNHLYKLIEYGGLTLYAILVGRKFGPELNGSYAVFLSICGTLAIVGAFAVDGVLLRYLPRILRGELTFGEAKVEGIRPFLIELLAFRLFVTLVLIGLLILLLVVLPAYFPSLSSSLGTIRSLWPYFVIYLLGQALLAFSTYTLIGILQIKWVFFASLFSRALLLAAGVLWIYFGNFSLEGAAALFAFSAVLNGVLLLYWVNRHVERESSRGLKKEFNHFRKRLAGYASNPNRIRIFILLPFMLYGVTVWGNDILSTVLGRQPDILMMRALLGENARDIGLYHAASMLAQMTEYIFLFGLGGALVSVFSELAHDDEQRAPASLAQKSVRLHYPRLSNARREIAGYQTVVTTPAFTFMMAFSPLVIEVIYGHKYTGAEHLLFASLILQTITVVVFGGGMHVTSLVAIGKERVVFVNRLSWGLLNLVVNYFLIQSYGGLGAMIGTQCANAGSCATESFFTTRWIGQSLQPARTAAILVIVIASVLITYFAISTFGAGIPVVLRLLAAGILMALLTGTGYAIFKIPEARKAFDKIRSLFGNSRIDTPGRP